MPAATKDAVLRSAVDLAREVALDLAERPSDVGEHLGVRVEGERLVSHRFACEARGYVGWEWTVTVARVPRGRTATICEAELLPGDGAILATDWLPWDQRLQPGDIGPGDVLPFRADDPRLEPGWTSSGDAEQDAVAIDELALARARVLSQDGIAEAAERWFRGSHGPTSAGSVASEGACSTCGFLVPLQGSLGTVFGVCVNEWSPDDGKVVALEHGCGAHSETDVPAHPSDWPAPSAIVDEQALEVVELPEHVASDEPAAAREPDGATDPSTAEPTPGGTHELETSGESSPIVPLPDEATGELAPAEHEPAELTPDDEAPVDPDAAADLPAEDPTPDSEPDPEP